MATKNVPREVLGILRQFEIAGSLTVPKEIRILNETEPRLGVRIISCIFENTQYFIIADSNADDNTTILLDYINALRPDTQGSFIRNPHEDSFTTYGIRHKFRDMYLFKVEKARSRLDVELAKRYPNLSRSTLQKYIKSGYVSVNGVVITKPKHDTTDVDDIALQPQEMPSHDGKTLPIIYSDDHVIVVNKPNGVLTHSKGVLSTEFTVADFFRRYTHVGLATNRPGVVHRLDRDTSGVIVGARDEQAATLLKKQFADRTVHKHYLAIVHGTPKEPRANIDLPIGRNPSAPSTFRVDSSGKVAQTSYEMLATNGEYSLLLLKPLTGRTHQLRVHLEYINTPIVGDRVYGRKVASDRLYLHALRLEVTTPPSRRQVFYAPAPKEFTDKFPEAKNV